MIEDDRHILLRDFKPLLTGDDVNENHSGANTWPLDTDVANWKHCTFQDGRLVKTELLS